jgi:predicted NBD/HSP70 family sugar kinase
MNERSVLEIVLREGAISRAELARATGLSKPTISLALSRLEEAGLLREVGRTSGNRGATALLYDLDPSSGHVLAIDVGRRWVRMVLADIAGRTRARRNERTAARGGRQLPNQIGRIAKDLAAEAGLSLQDVAAATIGSPGVVQADGDHMQLAPSLPGLQTRGAIDRLRDELGGAPLRVENDVNLAGLAELANGHGTEHDDFVFVSVGTGVGMALVLGGELRRGASGTAGEIGFLPLPTGAPPRRGLGMYESGVDAYAFVRAARERGLKVTKAEQVVALARAGNASAQDVVRREGELLGHGIAAVTAVLDPELVVLGGPMAARAGGRFQEAIAARLAILDKPGAPPPRVELSRIGVDAGVTGAATLVLHDLYTPTMGKLSLAVPAGARPGDGPHQQQEETTCAPSSRRSRSRSPSP